jgi:hypothetical protein
MVGHLSIAVDSPHQAPQDRAGGEFVILDLIAKC